MARVPILCYHHVAAARAGSQLPMLYVTPEQFERQLWALKQLGLRGVSLGEAVERLRDRRRSDLVALTFDDGYLGTMAVTAPLLARYGFRATCFVVTGRIGAHNSWDDGVPGERHRLVGREQLADWLARGMEIGSHSCTHPRLTELEDAAAAREIADSAQALRQMFGIQPRQFAYPFGALTARTAALVRRTGYRSAVTTRPGTAGAGDDPYQLPRIFIDGQRGLGRFLLQVGTPFENLRHGRAVFGG